jgi:hypothetical protein
MTIFIFTTEFLGSIYIDISTVDGIIIIIGIIIHNVTLNVIAVITNTVFIVVIIIIFITIIITMSL